MNTELLLLTIWHTRSYRHMVPRLSRGLRGREQSLAAKFHTRQKSRKTHLRLIKKTTTVLQQLILNSFVQIQWLAEFVFKFFSTSQQEVFHTSLNSLQLSTHQSWKQVNFLQQAEFCGLQTFEQPFRLFICGVCLQNNIKQIETFLLPYKSWPRSTDHQRHHSEPWLKPAYTITIETSELWSVTAGSRMSC